MPDPRLKKPSRKINHVNDEFRQLIADMGETMRKYDGVGLAAVQVGVHKRFFLIRIPELIEDHLDPDEAIELLESDDPQAKKGIYEIISTNMEDPDAEPVITYVRRSLYWPEPTLLINPRIVEKEGAIIDDEGCLSDMGYQAKVERARRVIVAAHDIDMNPIQIEAKGLEARCLQHEYDHLEGIIYHDRMIEDTRESMHGDDEDEETGDDETAEEDETPDGDKGKEPGE
jgi:peptide deformylase